MSETSTNFAYISGLWQSVSDRGRALVGLRRPAPVNVEALIELARRLLSGRGEASGAANAETLLEGYESLGEADQRSFLTRICEIFGPDLDALQNAARAFLDAPDGAHAAEIFRPRRADTAGAHPPAQPRSRRHPCAGEDAQDAR